MMQIAMGALEAMGPDWGPPMVVLVAGGAWVLQRFTGASPEAKRRIELGFLVELSELKPVYVYVDGMRALGL